MSSEISTQSIYTPKHCVGKDATSLTMKDFTIEELYKQAPCDTAFLLVGVVFVLYVLWVMNGGQNYLGVGEDTLQIILLAGAGLAGYSAWHSRDLFKGFMDSDFINTCH